MRFSTFQKTGCTAALLLMTAVLNAQDADVSFEPGINRIGMDYRDIVLPKADPGLCQMACAEDPHCEAFTYVKPRLRRETGRCWLKDSVPAATKSDCCVSGVKQHEAITPVAERWDDTTPDVPITDLATFSQPVSRAKVIDTLLGNPPTAELLRSEPALGNRKAVDLVGMSLAGKTVQTKAQAATGSFSQLKLIELDWEAGVQFTPNNRWGQLAVEGMYLPGTQSLVQLYQADQLYVYAKESTIRWSSVVHPGPGIYGLTVQMRMPMIHAAYTRIYVFESDASGISIRQVEPTTGLKNTDTPSNYVDGFAALLKLHKSSELKLLIETSNAMFLPPEGAVFGGFTITRL